MKRISDLFEVKYGTNHELNAMRKDPDGCNFVSRTSVNNGVSEKVALNKGEKPIQAGVLTVAGGGSVLETFLQPKPFYSGRDLYYLVPKRKMTVQEKVYYCCCIRANKYRYNYGRQANRTLKNILVPSKRQIPKWVNMVKITNYTKLENSIGKLKGKLPPVKKWKRFKLCELFEIKKGQRIVKSKLQPGSVPFIAAIESNNGRREFFKGPALFEGNTISVNYNGNIAEAFYQPVPFWASDDVNVLYPKFELNSRIAMFLNTIIKKEKYRFNYGRKWGLERMKESHIELPANRKGKPDWEKIYKYICGLKFSGAV